MPVHPLIFQPLFVPKVWGGRRLAALFGKSLPPDQPIGESWECADRPAAQSIVAAGPARGRTLGQLVREWGADLTGRAALAEGRFPLLIKFLDCREPLSIQVHPGNGTAESGAADGRVKHEAWYVIDAAADAVIYHGLRPGTTAEAVAAAAGRRELVGLMNAVPARPGRSLYCPGGTLHALGGGLVVAEVQTPSEVTYRLYDWDRARPAGDAGLHLREGVAALDWDAPAAALPARSHVGGLFTTVTRLVSCAAFNIEKVRFVEGMVQPVPYAELVVWIVLSGRGAIAHAAGDELPFRAGDVVVLPAGLKGGTLKTASDCVWLEVTIPTPSDLAAYARPPAEALRDAPTVGRGVVPLGLPAAHRPPEGNPP